MKALVTGGAGFVGRHLIPELVKAGYEVVSVDPKHGLFDVGDGVAYVQGIAENYIRRVEANAFDAVFHLAAHIVDVDTRSRMGVEVYGDLILDYEICQWIEENPPKVFVAMSSCATDNGNPADCYGFIKVALEKYCERLVKKGVNVALLRPFSGYGADQSKDYPFRAILERALAKEDPLVVWGGTQVRDWVHISDLVSAIVKASMGGFPFGVPIEIGTGIGTSFYDFAKKVADAVGYEPEIRGDFNKAMAADVRIAKDPLANIYGWEPKVTLEEGIKQAVEAHK